MGHARREFVKAEMSDPIRVGQVLELIGRLYDVERDAKALDPTTRLALRQRYSVPILSELQAFITAIVTDPRVLPKSQLLKACKYSSTRWQQLTVYTTNGEPEIDNLPIERQIKYVALGRKNWLFCASEIGANALADLYSIVNSCRMASIQPFDYLVDVLVRVQTHPRSQIHQLMPKNWKNLFAVKA